MIREACKVLAARDRMELDWTRGPRERELDIDRRSVIPRSTVGKSSCTMMMVPMRGFRVPILGQAGPPQDSSIPGEMLGSGVGFDGSVGESEVARYVDSSRRQQVQ